MKSVQQWLHGRALHSADANVRLRAVEKLTTSPDPQAVPDLLELLDDPTPAVRLAVVGALETAGDVRATKPLVGIVLNEQDANFRERAVGAIAKIDQAGATAILLVELDNSDVPIRQAAGSALHRIAWSELNDTQKARVAIVQNNWDEIPRFGSAAVEPLEASFRSGTQRIRSDSAEALGQIGTEDAAGALVTLVSDYELDQRSRELAGRALRRYFPDDLSDAQQALICIALEEWSDLPDLGPAAIEALVSALPYPTVRNDAARALIQIGATGVYALVDLLKNPKADSTVREAAAISLAEIGDRLALDPLMQMLTDPDAAIRHAAVWALERLGWHPEDDGQRALVAIANDNWDEVRKLGAVAAEHLICMAKDSLITPQGLEALASILAVSPECLTPAQLRDISALDSRAPVHAGAESFGGQVEDHRLRLNFDSVVTLAQTQLSQRGIK